MSELIVNRVEESSLVTIDLETFLPEAQPKVFDLKDYLFMGLILKEKEFRESLKAKKWEEFRNETVLVICSADAIVPVWAWMLIVSYLQPQTEKVTMETKEHWQKRELLKAIKNLNAESYTGKRIVIKGCGKEPIPAEAYMEITKLLLPVAKSIMYGEPCSTVPIYKQK